MKTSQSRLLGMAIAIVLVIGLGSAVQAGPGPQYWQTVNRRTTPSAAQKTSDVQSQQPSAAPGMACSSCMTKVYEETGLPNLADKTKPRAVKVGVRHYCGSCVGTITRISGGVTDTMKRNHAACATTACCTTS